MVYEKSALNISDLKEAISAQKDPQRKAILEEELAKIEPPSNTFSVEEAYGKPTGEFSLDEAYLVRRIAEPLTDPSLTLGPFGTVWTAVRSRSSPPRPRNRVHGAGVAMKAHV